MSHDVDPVVKGRVKPAVSCEAGAARNVHRVLKGEQALIVANEEVFLLEDPDSFLAYVIVHVE